MGFVWDVCHRSSRVLSGVLELPKGLRWQTSFDGTESGVPGLEGLMHHEQIAQYGTKLKLDSSWNTGSFKHNGRHTEYSRLIDRALHSAVAALSPAAELVVLLIPLPD